MKKSIFIILLLLFVFGCGKEPQKQANNQVITSEVIQTTPETIQPKEEVKTEQNVISAKQKTLPTEQKQKVSPAKPKQRKIIGYKEVPVRTYTTAKGSKVTEYKQVPIYK